MLSRFFLMSLQTLEISFNNNRKAYKNLRPIPYYKSSIFFNGISNSDHLIIENYKHSDFFRLSKTLNDIVSNNHEFSHEEDKNIQIQLNYNPYVVEFIKKFVEEISDDSITKKEGNHYLDLFNDFIDYFISSELQNEEHELKSKKIELIYYLHAVFNCLDFDFPIKIKFSRIIYLLLKENGIFDKNKIFYYFPNYEIILDNFYSIFYGRNIDFKYWNDDTLEIYDSIFFFYMNHELYKDPLYTNFSLNISEKLQKIQKNMNILKYLESLNIYDIYTFYNFCNFLSSLPNKSSLNLKNLELNFSFNDVILDTYEYPKLYEILPNLQSFSYVGSILNFSTGIKFFKMLPKLTEIHFKFYIDSGDPNFYTSFENLGEFINTKEIKICDILDLENYEWFFNSFIYLLRNNNFIQILYLKEEFKNYSKWFNYLSRDDRCSNLKCLVIRSVDEISNGFINILRNKINCLIQIRNIDSRKIFHLKSLKDDYELKYVRLYQNENDISCIVLEDVNLEEEDEIKEINNLNIKKLEIKDSIVSIRFFENFHRSKLRESLNSLVFENVIVMMEENYENNSMLNFKSFTLKNMDIPDGFIDGVLKKVNTHKLKLENVYFNMENFLKLRPMLMNAKYLSIYNMDLNIKYLNIIYENNDTKRNFSKRELYYKSKERLTIRNFDDFDKLQGFERIVLENYDDEFREKIEEKDYKNSKGAMFYLFRENDGNTNPFAS